MLCLKNIIRGRRVREGMRIPSRWDAIHIRVMHIQLVPVKNISKRLDIIVKTLNQNISKRSSIIVPGYQLCK
jgi:hypothetical protein